jgi:tetratricopeptide (TPR) repeat protein
MHSQGLFNLACIKWRLGDYLIAQLHAKEAQRLARITADLFREAQALDIEATCSCALGHYKQGITSYNRARELLSLCGMVNSHLDHHIRSMQAEIHQKKSEYRQAHSIHTRILQETSVHQDLYNYGFALLNVAEIDVAIGAPTDDVQRNCDMARKIFDTAGFAVGVAMCDITLADLYLRDGDVLASKTILEQCFKISARHSQIISHCLEQLGDPSHWGILDGMTSQTTVFLVHSLKSKEKLGIHKALKFMGDVFLTEDDEVTATALFTVALEGFDQMDVHRGRAECMLRLGDISKSHGSLFKAVKLWKSARPLFEQASQAKQVERVDERLAGISEDVLEQHKTNLARLAELNVPSATMKDMDNFSDVEAMEEQDDEKELPLVAV